MTTLWASIFGIVSALVGVLGLVFGHRLGAKDKDREVQVAKELTERETRQKVADELTVVSEQAKSSADASRQVSDAQAKAVSAKGSDAINDALKDQGALRD